MRDTITLIHQNIPYLQNIECGTMMFYKVEDIKYTTYNLKSIEIVNSDINNEEKRISTYITLLTLLSSMLLYSPTLAAQEKTTHRGRKGTLLSGNYYRCRYIWPGKQNFWR